eukprot:CCRYP_005075-RA/>CCRYP_005075-RA protein AED:0.02 eAED:0.02 QI:249/1/1/1/1/1/2/136/571
MKENQHLKVYIERLGLPPSCLSTITQVYKQMAARIWVIENSHAMKKKDSHLIIAAANLEKIERKDGVSRWSDLSQCIDFHTEMAAQCWIPSKYWLVNEPGGDSPKRFSLGWGKGEEVRSESERIIQVMKETKLDSKASPLARQLRNIEKYISKEASMLRDQNKFIGVVVCTQGEPTDRKGDKGKDVLRDFVKSLASLSDLPVKTVFRLCTDNDLVVDFYNTLDVNEKCDVLDDFWGEAMEVYLHNPWLTYGIGLHRLREACLATDLIDNLDETSFTLEEIHEFCVDFFVGKNSDVPLANPCHDFPGFVSDLRNILKSQELVWNPVKNKLCPWVDVDKLNTIFRRASAMGRGERRESFCRGMSSKNISHEDMQNGGTQSLGHRSNFPQQKLRRCHTTNTPQASPPPLPKAPLRRANTDCSSKKSAESPAEGNVMKESSSQFMKHSEPKDLNEAIKRWSHPTAEPAPLETLLVDVPKLFPVSNDYVEDHEYFDKWKEFSEDAFYGQSSEEKNELLRRAARKARLFLHPDKLPQDLTENQRHLFKSIWNVLSKSVYKTESTVKVDLECFSKSNF